MQNDALYSLLYANFDWHPSRISAFTDLVMGVIKAKTITIKELAMNVGSKGDLHAQIIKTERFLLKQKIDYVSLGKIIFNLIKKENKIMIAIDRTNWKFGKKDINFLVATLVLDGISIPIVWELLESQGNSNTAERQALIQQVLQIIPKENIECIVADREFIGEEWFKYLDETQGLNFAIRVKKSEQIPHPNGGKVKLSHVFKDINETDIMTHKTKIYKTPIQITALGLPQEELLIVAIPISNDFAEFASCLYKIFFFFFNSSIQF